MAAKPIFQVAVLLAALVCGSYSQQITDGADIVFVLDGSGSVSEPNFRLVLDLVGAISGSLALSPTRGYQVGVVSYGNEGHVEIQLNETHDSVEFSEKLMSDVTYWDENTNTSGALRVMRTEVFGDTGSGVRSGCWVKIGVLITDGKSTRDAELTIPEAMAVAQENIHMGVLAIGSVNDLNIEELEAISQNGVLLFEDDFDFDGTLQPTIVEAIRYIGATSTCMVDDEGTTGDEEVDNEVTDNDGEMSNEVIDNDGEMSNEVIDNHGSNGTETTPATRPTENSMENGEETRVIRGADVMFILDGSGSVGEDNFRDHVLPFIAQISRQLPLGIDAYQVGVITFGNEATVEISLFEHNTTSSLTTDMANLTYRDENTNTSGALWMMRTGVHSNASSGARHGNWPLIGVMVTDGASTRDVNRTIPEAGLIHALNIPMITVAVGTHLNEEELSAIASSPKEDYLLRAPTFDLLELYTQDVVDLIVDASFYEEVVVSSSTMIPTVVTSSPMQSTTMMDSSMESTRMMGSTTIMESTTMQSMESTSTMRATTAVQVMESTTRQDSTPTIVPAATSTMMESTRRESTPAVQTSTTTRPEASTSGVVSTSGPVQFTEGADIIFLLDGSGSVSNHSFHNALLPFVNTITSDLQLGANQYQVGVVSFGNEATVDVALNETYDHDGFERVLMRVPFKDENTNTSGGLWLTRMTLIHNVSAGARSQPWPKVGVLLTDGRSTYDSHRTIPEAEALHAAGITMVTVAIGNDLDLDELTAISSMPTDTYLLRHETFEDLGTDGASREVIDLIRQAAQVEIPSTGVPTTSTTTGAPTTSTTTGAPTTMSTGSPTTMSTGAPTTMSTGAPTTSTTTGAPTPSTTTGAPTTMSTGAPTTMSTGAPTTMSTGAPTTTTTTGAPTTSATTGVQTSTTTTGAPTTTTAEQRQEGADLVFVIDASGSVGQSNFYDFALEFVCSTLDWLSGLSMRSYQAGVITFGNEATLEIKLNATYDKEVLEELIRDIQYKDENTNTSGGLRLLRETLSSPSAGARDDMWPKIGILVTDGRSTYDRNLTIPEAELLHQAHIHMIVLAVGNTNQLDQDELVAIATEPIDQNLHRFDTFDQLVEEDTVERVVRNVREEAAVEGMPPRVNTSTTEMPPRVNASTTEMPPRVNGTTTEMPRVNGTTTEMPPRVNGTTTEMPPRVNGTTTEMPRVNGTTTEMPRVNGTTTEMPHVNGTTTEMPRINGTTTEMPRVNGSTTEMPRVNGTTTEMPRVNGTNTEMPRVNGTTTEMPLVNGTTTEMPLVNGTTTEMPLVNGTTTDMPSVNTTTQMPNVNTTTQMPSVNTTTQMPSVNTTTPMPSVNTTTQMPSVNTTTEMPSVNTTTEMPSVNTTTTEMPRVNTTTIAIPMENETTTTHLPRETDEVTTVITSTNPTTTTTTESPTTQTESQTTQTPTSTTETTETPLTTTPEDEQPSTSLPWSCGFESDQSPFCGMTQSTMDEFDWTRRSGATPSQPTGPSAAMSGDYYVYIEATGRSVNDTASLVLPSLQTTTPNSSACVTFSAHMYGHHTGSLVLLHAHAQGEDVLIEENGEQGDFWFTVSVTVGSLAAEDKLTFVGVRGTEYSGDIGLDDISVTEGTC